jgi:hypothetical protein
METSTQRFRPSKYDTLFQIAAIVLLVLALIIVFVTLTQTTVLTSLLLSSSCDGLSKTSAASTLTAFNVPNCWLLR